MYTPLRSSLAGLLGVRRLREQEKARKNYERLRARNRPTHKVGPLTALSNFIRAAHAAEKSAKAKRSGAPTRPAASLRRHTEPAGSLETMASLEISQRHSEDLSKPLDHSRSPSLRASGPPSRRTSLDTRHLSTISEDAVSEANDDIPPSTDSIRDDAAYPAQAEPFSSPTYLWNHIASARPPYDAPPAPRLLPIQLSVPPSPLTPHVSGTSSDPSGHHQQNGGASTSDYISARPRRSLDTPRTPRLGPTLLSLPPSPMTTPQHGHHGFHFQLGTTSTVGSPLTPRLVPTHLEVLPSPFATPGGEAPRLSSVPASPLTPLASTDLDNPFAQAGLADGQLPRSPRLEARRNWGNWPSMPGQTAPNPSTPTSGRLTPSTVMADLYNMGDMATGQSLPKVSKAVDRDHRRSTQPSSKERLTKDAPILQDAGHNSTLAEGEARRSFLLWFLIGDLWMGTRSSIAAKVVDPSSTPPMSANLGGLAGGVVHVFGFVVFCCAHLLDLVYQAAENLALAFWFVRWLVLNLTGQTVLSRCLIEAYRLIQLEWETVAREDHEERGARLRERDGQKKPRGLTRWQVARGIVELVCLHTVTRAQYIRDGAGLERLDGWQRRGKKLNGLAYDQRNERLDIGTQRATAQAQRLAQVASDHDGYDDDDDDDDASSTGSSSSDEEMIVTNQDEDILEFTKTPRFEARTGQSRQTSSYFGIITRGSEPLTPQHDGKVTVQREDARSLVKTVKWASRLAISGELLSLMQKRSVVWPVSFLLTYFSGSTAYGLHVHIVDLPPTFTPSGERFSRQTFAHLSRLNADNVLHADIQTLDAEAAYSPTFYIVRDLARKVVVVAVRGTQSFQDIIVDLDIQSEHVDLPTASGIDDGQEELKCHAGVWRAAKALIGRDSMLFKKLREALEENEGFGVVFVGHSLGGAIASAVTLMLSEYHCPQEGVPEEGHWLTSATSGLPADRPIRAITFAHPVAVTAALARRSSLGAIPLVTTVVLGSDVIPRAGHGQVRELRRLLGALSRVRRRHAIADEGEEDARVHIVRSWWHWSSICNVTNPDAVMLDRKERIERQLWKLRCDVEADLYAAVKRRAATATTPFASAMPPSPWVGPQQRATAPLHQLSSRRQALDAVTLRSEAAQGGPLVPAGKVLWIHGTDIFTVTSPLAFFSVPDFQVSQSLVPDYHM